MLHPRLLLYFSGCGVKRVNRSISAALPHQRFRSAFVSLLLASIILFFSWQISLGQADAALTQVVVKINPLSGATIEQINATYGTTLLDTVLASRGIYLLQTPAGITADTVAKQMEADLRLLYAEPNFVGEAPEGVGRHTHVWGGPNAAPFAGQYAGELLGLPAAHQLTLGAGTVVAVLDRGVQLNHPELATSWTAARYDFVDDDAVPEDATNGVDDITFGHGTHVAGVVHLVAPAAQIMPLRVLDTTGRGNIFTLAEAIRYAIDQGADVINLSLGTEEKSELLADITRQATQGGVTVVAAAGNLNSEQEQYPAASQCVLAITAVNANRIKTEFANWGDWIDLAAPGDAIYSTLPGNNTGDAYGYGWWSGTSMATPFVAGQAALIYSLRPTLNVRQVANLIVHTARSLDQLNPQYEDKLGAGLPAIDLSLQRLLNGKLSNKGGVISGSCIESTAEAAAAADSETVDSETVESETVESETVESSEAGEATVLMQLFLPLVTR